MNDAVFAFLTFYFPFFFFKKKGNLVFSWREVKKLYFSIISEPQQHYIPGLQLRFWLAALAMNSSSPSLGGVSDGSLEVIENNHLVFLLNFYSRFNLKHRYSFSNLY